MTKKDTHISVHQPSDDVKALKRRVAELEVLLADSSSKKQGAFEDEGIYKAIFESANDSILFIDKKGKIVEFNNRLTEIGGYERNELIGTSIRSLAKMVTPKSFVAIIANFLKRMAGLQVQPYEVELIKKNGEVVNAEVSARPLEKGNKVIGDLVILRNISDRKQGEKALKESEEKYRLIVENSRDIILTLNILEELTYVSPSIKNAFGYEPAEFIGSSFRSLVHPDDIAAVEDVIQRDIKYGYQTPSGLEFRIRHHSGEWRWCNGKGSVLRDANGQFLNFVGIVSDITENKRVETALKESETKYRNVVELAQDGICIIQDKLIKYCNPSLAAIWGGAVEEITDTPFTDYLHATALPIITDRYNRRQKGELVPSRYETVLQHKNGKKIYVDVNVGTLNYLGQDAEIAIIHDITERKQAEDAIKESEQNFRDFLDNSSIGIRIRDDDEHVVYINRAFIDIFGFESIAEAQTAIPMKFYSPESYAEYFVRSEKISRGENVPNKVEVDIVRKDGTIRHVQVIGQRVHRNGKIQAQTLYIDITSTKHVENALIASEQNFRNSLDSSLIGIRIVDHKWHTMYANQIFLDIFGYKKVDEIGVVNPKELYTPKEYKKFLERHEKRLRGEPVSDNIEVEIVRRDGAVRYVQSSKSDVLWNGEPCYQLFFIDITARKEAEELLKISEQNLHTALDKLPVGCRITDIDDNTIYLNQAFLNIFGYANAEEVKTKPPLKDFYTPYSYADYLLRKEKFIRGEPRHDPVDVDIKRQDGSLRHLQLFHSELIWNGKQEFQTVYNDVTERKQAEEALKQSEQNFRNSLDTSLLGIRIVDADGRILYLNQTFLEIFGYKDVEEAKINPPQNYYTAESYANYLVRGKKLQRGEPVHENYEIEVMRKDGVVRNLQLFRKEVLWNGRTQHQILYNDITDRKRAEIALKASEQNFRNSMDNSSIGIRISDKKGNNLYSNQALLDIFGYNNHDKIQTNPPQNFYSPECYAAWTSRYEKFLRDEPMPKQVAIEIIRKDGTVKYLDVSMREVFWNGEQNYQTLYHDITEQKKIEMALRESEEKYHTIFESANDIIILLDTGGKILDVNSRLSDISGYGTEELIGRNISELTNIINKENMAVVVENLLNILAGSGVISYRVEMVKKNREPMYLEINDIPIRKDGSITGALAILRDVTERRKSEEQIKEQKALTDRILENTPDSMAVIGKNGQVIMVNKAFLHAFELTEDKANNTNVREIIPVPVFIDTLSQVLANSISQYQIEFRFKKGTQESVLIADFISMRQNEVQVHLHDVTEEREMQERLYQTDRLASVGEMAAGIAHELNNPLTGVVALSQLLLESGVPPEIKDDLQAISNEGQRAACVVKNMLSFARSHTLSTEPVDINAIITQVLNLRAYEHRVNNIEIVTHFADNLPEIIADHFQMQQVFINIVLNAEQSMIEAHGQGKLNITTERIKNIIKISFTDDGPGIPQDIINRIFDPFFTTKEVGKGTGLGLSICYGIIAKQGGRLYAKSPPGEGATFVIELPVYPD
jgi:PAS domain S-box-containing protein